MFYRNNRHSGNQRNMSEEIVVNTNTYVDDSDEENDKEQYGDTNTSNDIYHYSENKIIIKLNQFNYYYKDMNIVKTDRSNLMAVYRNKTESWVLCTVKLFGASVIVFPLKYRDEVDKTITTESIVINPHIIANKPTASPIGYSSVGLRNCVEIVTRTYDDKNDLIIKTSPTLVINDYVSYDGKVKVMPVAMIISILNVDDTIWVGALVRCKRNIYMIVDTHLYRDTGIIKLLAVLLVNTNKAIEIT